MKRAIGIATFGLGLIAMTATAQDMMRHVDLSSPDMVAAEMTRGDIEAGLAAATMSGDDRSTWRIMTCAVAVMAMRPRPNVAIPIARFIVNSADGVF